MAGLFFDTIIYDGYPDSLPPWRFFGNLKIDSVYYTDSIVPLKTKAQMSGIEIKSKALIKVLEKSKTYKLLRRIPDAITGDTLHWDPVREEWVTVADFSQFYAFRFSESISLDSVLSWLKQVPDLISSGAIPKSIPGDIEN